MKSLLVSTLALSLLCSMSFAGGWYSTHEHQGTMHATHARNDSTKPHTKHTMTVAQRTQYANIINAKIAVLETQLSTATGASQAKIQRKIDKLKQKLSAVEVAQPVTPQPATVKAQ